MSRGELTLNARAALLHVMGDLVSSFAAVIAGVVIFATGWLPIDPILSLVIAGLILASTLGLLRDALHVLIDDLRRWPGILSAASALLRDHHGIGHVTLQPEVRGAPGSGRTSVIRLWRNFRA